MDKIKLTEDEVKELTEVRANFQKTTLIIGETEIGIVNLKGRKEDKYGKGSISLDTNEFTPTEDDK